MNHEATIQYLEQRIAQLSIVNDEQLQELRRLRPQTVVSPKGRLVQMRQVSEDERIARVYFINIDSDLKVYAQPLSARKKLEKYHRMITKDGLIDSSITEDHFKPKYEADEIFQKPTNVARKKGIAQKPKANGKNHALAKK